MENYIDAMNYTEIADSVTAYVENDNNVTEEFFIHMKEQLLDILEQLKLGYAARSESIEVAGYGELPHPEDVPGFYKVSDETAEQNYEAWDRYCDCKELYEEDTRVMGSMIDKINRAIDLIGGLG